MKKALIIVASVSIAVIYAPLVFGKITNPCIQACDKKQKECSAYAKNKHEFRDCKKAASVCMKECRRKSR